MATGRQRSISMWGSVGWLVSFASSKAERWGGRYHVLNGVVEGVNYVCEVSVCAWVDGFYNVCKVQRMVCVCVCLD